MSEASKKASAVAVVLKRAAGNATGWASTLGGVALIVLGIGMAWKLGAPNEGVAAIVFGIGLVFARDQQAAPAAPGEPEKAEKVNGAE